MSLIGGRAANAVSPIRADRGHVFHARYREAGRYSDGVDTTDLIALAGVVAAVASAIAAFLAWRAAAGSTQAAAQMAAIELERRRVERTPQLSYLLKPALSLSAGPPGTRGRFRRPVRRRGPQRSRRRGATGLRIPGALEGRRRSWGTRRTSTRIRHRQRDAVGLRRTQPKQQKHPLTALAQVLPVASSSSTHLCSRATRGAMMSRRLRRTRPGLPSLCDVGRA